MDINDLNTLQTLKPLLKIIHDARTEMGVEEEDLVEVLAERSGKSEAEMQLIIKIYNQLVEKGALSFFEGE